MTFWLVISLTLMAMLSPMVWLRPSSRDKRLGNLRQYARHLGIDVKFAKPPLYAPPGGLIRYRWRYAQERPGPYFVLVRHDQASTALKPFDAQWRWRIEPLRKLSDDAHRCLQQALDTLPDDALVVESGRQHLALWWGESKGVDAFDGVQARMIEVLEALAGSGAERAPNVGKASW